MTAKPETEKPDRRKANLYGSFYESFFDPVTMPFGGLLLAAVLFASIGGTMAALLHTSWTSPFATALLAAIATVVLAVAQKSKRRSLKADQSAVSPVIGVILMVAITVVLATVVFVLVSDLGAVDEKAPDLVLEDQGDGAFLVLTVDEDVDWSDLRVLTCDTVPTGAVEAGQELSGCSDPLRVVHEPTETVVWRSG